MFICWCINDYTVIADSCAAGSNCCHCWHRNWSSCRTAKHLPGDTLQRRLPAGTYLLLTRLDSSPVRSTPAAASFLAPPVNRLNPGILLLPRPAASEVLLLLLPVAFGAAASALLPAACRPNPNQLTFLLGSTKEEQAQKNSNEQLA
jgi:hypothetical protein